MIIALLITALLKFNVGGYQKTPLSKTMEKDKIIYVYDPMCGWCFGFGKGRGGCVAPGPGRRGNR